MDKIFKIGLLVIGTLNNKEGTGKGAKSCDKQNVKISSSRNL